MLFDIPTGAAVAGFLALSALAHLLVCTAWRSHYFADLARHRNQARWVEYSASSSLMIVLIAQLVGIADVAALLAFAPITARLADSLPHAPMGTLVGGLVVMVNGVTVVAALGGLPGWLDAVLLLLAGLIVCTYARRAWTLEKNSRSVSDHQLLSDS